MEASTKCSLSDSTEIRLPGEENRNGLSGVGRVAWTVASRSRAIRSLPDGGPCLDIQAVQFGCGDLEAPGPEARGKLSGAPASCGITYQGRRQLADQACLRWSDFRRIIRSARGQREEGSQGQKRSIWGMQGVGWGEEGGFGPADKGRSKAIRCWNGAAKL